MGKARERKGGKNYSSFESFYLGYKELIFEEKNE